MAMNPMQRRARNSFLVGFLVALIIMALVVVFLLYRMKLLNEAKLKLEEQQKQVFVAVEDLKSGESVTLEDNFNMSTVRTTVDESEIISSDDFLKEDEDGELVEQEMIMKIDVPAGTIVTKDMIVAAGEEVTDTQRIQEYNMIVLPTQLKNGEYIDIRLSMPSGQDFIVLAKKKVLGCTETSIWINVDETEILTMNNAIVESYQTTGSKIYAIPYIEAGMQKAAIPTYFASAEVLDSIDHNPNIKDEARNALRQRYNEENYGDKRAEYFDSVISPYSDQRDSLVQSGFSSEVENLKAARQEFVESLEGSDEIGYTR